MFFHVTKLTAERYGVYLHKFDKQTDPIFSWGCKLFYLCGKKCLELVNFSSKLTILLLDVRKSEIKDIERYLDFYLSKLYEHDEEFRPILEEYLIIGRERDNSKIVKITDRKAIAQLNTIQVQLLEYGVIDKCVNSEGFIDTMAAADFLNFQRIYFHTINNVRTVEYSGVLFKKQLIEWYAKQAKD